MARVLRHAGIVRRSADRAAVVVVALVGNTRKLAAAATIHAFGTPTVAHLGTRLLEGQEEPFMVQARRTLESVLRLRQSQYGRT